MSDRDYLERTIATVRNHRDADNSWPQWANIFADEIEHQWAEVKRLRAANELLTLERNELSLANQQLRMEAEGFAGETEAE